jgi:isoprenylcysteine carboxyl methyltransferase (ICMT) family protein YpbQ
MFPLVLLAAAFVPMIGEALLSARHERALRARGAIEPPRDVHSTMRIAYPASFAVMIGEASLRRRAITGPRWTFRVLVPRGSTRTTAGPYRLLRHPNYVGVAGELLGMALMARAPITGTISIVLFGRLMFKRIQIEERALAEAGE